MALRLFRGFAPIICINHKKEVRRIGAKKLMELLTRYSAQEYRDAARLYMDHVFNGKDYNIPAELGTKMCNAIVEYAVYNAFPEWTAEDAIRNMTPKLFCDLGLCPLLRQNQPRQKLFCPPFLLVSGEFAFPGDPVRSKVEFSSINYRFVMQWVFGMDPTWEEVVTYYYDWLNGLKKRSDRPNFVRCSRWIFEDWQFEGKDYTVHDRHETAFVVMSLLLRDLEREGKLNPGPMSNRTEYQKKVYRYFAENGNEALKQHCLASYYKMYPGSGAKRGNPTAYIHHYLTSKGMGSFVISEQVRLDLPEEAYQKKVAGKPARS